MELNRDSPQCQHSLKCSATALVQLTGTLVLNENQDIVSIPSLSPCFGPCFINIMLYVGLIFAMPKNHAKSKTWSSVVC